MVIREIRNCARCGNCHDNIELTEFNIYVIDQYGDLLYNYFGLCPNNNQPILVKVTIEKDQK